MLSCSEFLEGYTEFHDGRMDAPALAAFQDHLDSCPSCARYDRVITGGVSLFRSLPELEPSEDFAARLQHRIFHLEDERRVDRSGTRLVVTAGIAAAIGATAWLPVLRPEPEPVLLPPVMAAAPRRPEVVPLLFRSGPLLVRQQSDPAYGRAPEESLFPVYTPLGTFSAHQAPVFSTVSH